MAVPPAAGRTASLDLFAVLAMVVLCASWGGNQVAIKVATAEVPPVIQAGLRSAVAAVLLVAYMAVRGLPVLARDGTLWLGLCAGLLFAVEFMLLFWGLSFTTAGRAVVFLYVAPFVVALGAHLFVPGERIRPAQVLGLACAFVGLYLAFGGGDSPSAAGQIVGDLMALAAGVLWGATTVLIKATRLVRASPHRVLLYQLAVSGLALPPAGLLLGEALSGLPGAVTLGSLAYQTIWVAFITYLAWFGLVQTYPAALLSSFTFLAPVLGTFASAILLDEPLTPQVFATLGLVSAGILLVNHPFVPRARES